MQAIITKLEQQRENLQTLQSSLDEELRLISSREADKLLSLVESKKQLLDAIQELDSELALEFSNLSDIPPQVQSLKSDIVDLVEDCKYRTQINEKAVEQGQLKLEHLRHTIVEARAKESLTYDKTGKKHAASSLTGVKA